MTGLHLTPTLAASGALGAILEIVITVAYLVGAVMFIFGLKMMNRVKDARRGNILSGIGMAIAVVATLINPEITGNPASLPKILIAAGLIIGGGIGYWQASTVPMTGMPQLVALFNGFGGLASLLVGWAEYTARPGEPVSSYTAFVISLAVLIGGVTLTGSLIAWAKLQEVMTGKPIVFPGMPVFNAALGIGALVLGILLTVNPANTTIFYALLGLSLVLGVLVTIPIGGADMPVVIALLNSYSGMAAGMAGFVLENMMLIVAGGLVGASGIILSMVMCKAMNRSLSNVLFGAMAAASGPKREGKTGEIKSLPAPDAYPVLEAASSVVFVPGYGMAVAQAQHVIKELAEQLEDHGCEVRFAIHPVAGRMPGHMNVLLAEASVSYDKLWEMDAINEVMEGVDVAVVVGANDTVNPEARHDKSSPIFGMPIIDVDKARQVFVLKRGKGTGFSGIENELFFYPNTTMIYGDAKETLATLVGEFKSAE